MLNIITKGITAIFGTKSERDLKELLPFVEKINNAYKQLSNLSDGELRGETRKLKAVIAERLSQIDSQINAIRADIEGRSDLQVHEKEKLFVKLEGLELERNKELEKVLLDILPQGFAVVKETARRYKENGGLRVPAEAHDLAMAAIRPHIKIEGGEAFWPNEWNAAGNTITWDMLHYDVQLIGGVVLHQGKISEMATGEGKTLVATLPAYLNALAGRGVHIVTVNDYLARRDSQWMGPLFEFHEMRVDCIDLHDPNSEARRNAYLADITYGTNNEYGFDYLRDNMAREPQELVQRKLHFAMVDEVDSVLIDDARTPLIISGPMSKGGEALEFDALKPRVSRVVEAQKQLVGQLLVEAKKKLSEGNEKEGGLALFRAHRGLPKYKPLIKFLSETGNKAVLQKTENYYLQDNQKNMPEADKPLFFTIDEKSNSVDLTENGLEFMTQGMEDPNFFIMPDLATELGAIEKRKDISEEEILVLKDRLIGDFEEKTRRIHTIQQLLKAYTLFEKEVEYIIVEGKIKIVDEQTGRIMEGRRYSDGLHQAIEAKESVKVEDSTQTYATVTLQNFFRMYHKLCGMTGTAETEAGEFFTIYKLDVVVIPTNKKITRKDGQDRVYKTVREKFNAVVDEIVDLTNKGRPVLVGTTSVEKSELLSRMLKIKNIKHQVLNAKYHQKEAEIVAEAGKPSTVTIATNMAGRGTDIKLSPESKAAGGLAIIGTERHESRRVDRQLRGRAGRQGDPGTSEFFVSLEDDLMRLFGSDRIIKLMDKMGLEEGEVIQHSMITSSIERAQKKVEENHFATRKRLLEYDDVMNSQREVIYKRRRNALFGDRLELDILSMIYESCEFAATQAKSVNKWDELQLKCIHLFGHGATKITANDFAKMKVDELAKKLYEEFASIYRSHSLSVSEQTLPVFSMIREQQGAGVEQVIVPLTDGKRHMQIAVHLNRNIETGGKELIRSLEKFCVLNFIDMAWKEHLREMDDLKQSVQNAVFEQKDPLLVYKFEALKMFQQLIAKINEDVLTFLFKFGIPIQDEPVAEAPRNRMPNVQRPKLKESRTEVVDQEVAVEEPSVSVPKIPVRAEKTVNRNDKVSVRYANGEIRKDVKYKTVEDDLLNNRCVIVDLT